MMSHELSHLVDNSLCPNCGEKHSGLYSNEEHGVRHCGCYYEGDPEKVTYHIERDVQGKGQ